MLVRLLITGVCSVTLKPLKEFWSNETEMLFMSRRCAFISTKAVCGQGHTISSNALYASILCLTFWISWKDFKISGHKGYSLKHCTAALVQPPWQGQSYAKVAGAYCLGLSVCHSVCTSVCKILKFACNFWTVQLTVFTWYACSLTRAFRWHQH